MFKLYTPKRTAKDLSGESVSGWTILRRAPAINSQTRWLMRHTCGQQRYVYGSIFMSYQRDCKVPKCAKCEGGKKAAGDVG